MNHPFPQLQEPLSLGKLLSLSWELFVKHFSTIASITLIVSIPINFILGFVLLPPATNFSPEAMSQFGGYFKIALLLETFFGVLAVLAIAKVIQASFEQTSLNFKTALGQAVQLWPKIIGTELLLGLYLTGLTLLLVIPGVIYFVYWSFVSYAVALRQKAGGEALKYSKEIVTGRWWRVFGFGVALGLVMMGLVFAVDVITAPVATIKGIDFLINVGLDVAISYFTVVFSVFFLNLEATKTTK